MKFYLGTHVPSWLGRTEVIDAPLFVSHRTLRKYKTCPVAKGEWCLDSGGFSELSMFGKWTISKAEYIEAVERYIIEVGNLKWASPQDWMCEPFIIAKTGLTVEHHQWQTVNNFMELQDTGLPFIPVIQGYTMSEYEACVGFYEECGVDLTTFPTVGVGSVCRRQGTDEIGRLFAMLHSYGIKCHGFGVKAAGIAKYHPYMVSCDSMAWSYQARYQAPLRGCEHQNCANCIIYALIWRDQLLSLIDPTLIPPMFDYDGYEILSETTTGCRLRAD